MNVLKTALKELPDIEDALERAAPFLADVVMAETVRPSRGAGPSSSAHLHWTRPKTHTITASIERVQMSIEHSMTGLGPRLGGSVA